MDEQPKIPNDWPMIVGIDLPIAQFDPKAWLAAQAQSVQMILENCQNAKKEFGAYHWDWWNHPDDPTTLAHWLQPIGEPSDQSSREE